jgi:hypothetical protein
VPGKRSLDITIVEVTYVTEEWKKDNECCQACLHLYLLVRPTSIKLGIPLEQKGMITTYFVVIR